MRLAKWFAGLRRAGWQWNPETSESREIIAIHGENPDDIATIERWVQGGRTYREGDLPAMVHRRTDGSIDREIFFADGVRHRAEGPAEIRYFHDGAVRRVLYVYRGEHHRLDGPAILGYDQDGAVIERKYLYLGHEHEGLEEVFSSFARAAPEAAEDLLRASAYAGLLEEGASVEEIRTAIVGGVHTPEGIREVLDGAPVEWVAAWEASAGLAWRGQGPIPEIW